MCVMMYTSHVCHHVYITHSITYAGVSVMCNTQQYTHTHPHTHTHTRHVQYTGMASETDTCLLSVCVQCILDYIPHFTN